MHREGNTNSGSEASNGYASSGSLRAHYLNVQTLCQTSGEKQMLLPIGRYFAAAIVCNFIANTIDTKIMMELQILASGQVMSPSMCTNTINRNCLMH